MGRRVGKYKVSKKELKIYEHDVANGTFTNIDIGGNFECDGTLQAKSGVATFTAKSVHTAGLSATTGNIEVVAGTLDLQDGGTVTQGDGSGKATAVTLSTHSGQITMDDADLAATAEVTCVVTNTKVSATDVVIANHGSAGTTAAYTVEAHTIGSGVFSITVSNVTGGTLGEAIVINFAVIKGASS